MTEIKLYKTPIKALILITISTIFVVVIIGTTKVGDSIYGIIISYLSIAFFGTGIVVGIFHLFDKRPQIIINQDGIWDRTLKQDFILWNQIQNAYPINIYGQVFISLRLDESFKFKVKKYRWANRLNKHVGAQEINLNLGQIKIDHTKLTSFILKMRELEPNERRKEIKHAAEHGF